MPSPADLPVEYPTPRLKAAIIEFGSVHEECVPALAHLLRANAVEPTIYLSKWIRKHRPGFRARFPELADSVRFVSFKRMGKERLLERLRSEGTDLLVINTFQRDVHASSVSSWSGPVLGVVHNSHSMHSSELLKEMVGARRAGLLTLAPHVAADLFATDSLLYGGTASVTSTFPRPPRVKPHRSARRTVAFPGSVSVDTHSRDYHSVLDSLPGILDRVGRSDVRLTVVGGGGFGDLASKIHRRSRLEEEVARRGLSDVFHFAPLNAHGFVPSAEYYAHLRGADFILPPIAPDDPSFRTWKITSSMPTSIGLGVPAIIDRWMATVYGLPAVVFRAGAVDEGLERALSMDDGELASLKARLAAHKDRELARASEEMAWAIRAVGLPA